MLYLNHTPRPPLSRFVASLWYAENAPAHLFESLLPNGETNIVLNLRDATLRIYDPSDLPHPQSYTGPLFSGAHSQRYLIDTLQQTALMGVQFHPGGSGPFIRESAERFENTQVALEDLWGRSAMELQARLMEAPSHEVRFRRLEQALLDRLTGTILPHPAVAAAVSDFVVQQGNASVTAGAKRLGLSSRRFIELFRREVGLTPKVFCRVLKFQRALRLLSGNPPSRFAGVPFDCGYYDQAHFIREFKDFAGITPTAYLACRGDHYNHVKIVDRGSNSSNPGALPGGSMAVPDPFPHAAQRTNLDG